MNKILKDAINAWSDPGLCESLVFFRERIKEAENANELYIGSVALINRKNLNDMNGEQFNMLTNYLAEYGIWPGDWREGVEENPEKK